jgi:mannose-1-phosphate guanylyltransferase/mannose-1-phosphate guanylyltransferase/mannose-6-phosphate isomerase
MKRLSPLGNLTVIGHRALKALSNKLTQEHGIDGVRFIGEPMGRDTAPAVALACRLFQISGQEKEVIGIFPSDHLVRDEKVFIKAVNEASRWAEKGSVVTLGIKPTFPATGYGYIQTQRTDSQDPFPALPVLKFHEKPNLNRAKEYVDGGSFFWNAGIFVFRASQMIEHFQKFQPELWHQLSSLREDLSNIDDVYGQIKPVSFDYAIMEKLDPSALKCIPFDPDWNDVGSWDAVAEEALKSNMTATPGNEYVFNVDSKNNYLHAHEDKIYGFLGVDDLIVVDTPDALLVTKKGRSQDVKSLVDKVKEIRPEKIRDHLFEIRPWGDFEVLKNAENFKSKIIQVNAGQRISYQSHANREEHWIVIEGTGEVTLDDKKHPMQRGSYIKIPQGSKHRIENNGQSPLRFVEVQLGSYFGEDDIVRYQDDYDRK